jgi:hypothetical protein
MAPKPRLSAILRLGIAVYLLLLPLVVIAPPSGRDRFLALVAYLAVPFAFWALGRSVKKEAPRTAARPSSEAPPVAWISRLAWSTRRDAQRFVGLVDAGGPSGTLEDAELWPLQPLEPALAARLEAQLRATPAVGAFWQAARWPVCCAALSVLEVANPTHEELAALEGEGRWDHAALAPVSAQAEWRDALAGARAGHPIEEGVNLFRCAACGGRAGVYSHT